MKDISTKNWIGHVYTADEVQAIIEKAAQSGAKSVIIGTETKDFISDGVRCAQMTTPIVRLVF